MSIDFLKLRKIAYKIPILESKEELIKVIPTKKILVSPIYFLQGINGATANCYLRKEVYNRLINASNALPDNVILKIYDGYRPYKVQNYLFSTYRSKLKKLNPNKSDTFIDELTAEFVSKPSNNKLAPSPHSTGGSVDLTLCKIDGTPLDMGSGFDDFSKKSYTNYFNNSDSIQIIENRNLLLKVMNSSGFTNLPSEWWHFDYGNQMWAYFKRKDLAFYGLTKL